jgi:branched-chain amino acid transport system permease protein
MKRGLLLAGLAALVALPFAHPSGYLFHLAILVLIWGIVGTSWSYMGRFGLVSLGHGGFLAVGVYATALLWNLYGVPPWVGMPLGIVLALVLALAIGYPAFRFRVVGHYFALVTLAMGEVVRLSIIAARDITGGSLGMTPTRVQPPTDVSWYALQFADKRYFYYFALACWLLALWIWRRIDRSMARSALEAISEDEVAAASVGIQVTGQKLRVTLISAAMTALGGVLLGWYNQYLNPDSLSGIGISLEIVFAAIVGGMYSAPGPTIGSLLTISFRESLRTYFGVHLIGMAETIYGLLLILFIIFMPRGIYGALQEAWRRRRRPPAEPQPGPAQVR